MDFVINAGRVQLRRLQPDDLPAFAGYRADANVCRYQGFDVFTHAQAAEFIAEQATGPVPAPPGHWRQLAIARRTDGELLGDCALHLRADEPRFAEFGITIAPHWQGHGYGREALRGLLGCCFGQLGLHRVVALADTRNLASVALLEAVGMRREGHFLHNGWYKGEWCDEYQYALLDTDWTPGR
ncbi:MAG: ribosomal-protein-serine acetyltransferase [Hymenobacter sp.]|jgi:RimJ/RimL family protein N-acetyltransferase|nr:ribosomal-protein-serine acetyltransferase [Hymenobacter sp.]